MRALKKQSIFIEQSLKFNIRLFYKEIISNNIIENKYKKVNKLNKSLKYGIIFLLINFYRVKNNKISVGGINYGSI